MFALSIIIMLLVSASLILNLGNKPIAILSNSHQLHLFEHENP